MQGQNLDELFDVVDDHDRVIGRAPRREVHANNLLHRAVHIFAVNRAGAIFLQKRSALKDTNPGLWCSSCAGHVDAGEDYDRTVPRELTEELGIAPGTYPAPERLFKTAPCRDTGWEFVWTYRLHHDGPFTLNPAEVDAGEWLPVDAVTRAVAERPQDFTASFLLLWREYLRHG